ncbi:hypothetical protein Ciccas_008053 [Cichlidogyrus casuarinus]|uniref:Uncharacterized protein n=1 Tax=Cichlidogyrus casuarinus TaxID=1844966 RepID=A0ABD2Q3P5_9PLAT
MDYREIPIFQQGKGPLNMTKLLAQGYRLDNLGFLVSKTGVRYRLPTGPPENPRQIDPMGISSTAKPQSTESAQGDWMITRPIMLDPTTIKPSIGTLKQLPWNSIVLSLILNSFAAFINFVLVLVVIYRLVKLQRRRNRYAKTYSRGGNKPTLINPSISKSTRFFVPIDECNGFSNPGKQLTRIHSPYRPTDTASILSANSLGINSDPEERFLYNYSDAADSVFRG